MLTELEKILKNIFNQWDEWSLKHNQDGDNENKTKIDEWLNDLTPEAKKRNSQMEETNKDKANISIAIVQNDDDLSYLSMAALSNLLDKKEKLD